MAFLPLLNIRGNLLAFIEGLKAICINSVGTYHFVAIYWRFVKQQTKYSIL
jgi:hypothetical protein